MDFSNAVRRRVEHGFYEGFAYFHKFVTKSNTFQMVVLKWYVNPHESHYVKIKDAAMYTKKPHYSFEKLVVTVSDETLNYDFKSLSTEGGPLRPHRKADGTQWRTAERRLLEFKESEEYADELCGV